MTRKSLLKQEGNVEKWENSQIINRNNKENRCYFFKCVSHFLFVTLLLLPYTLLLPSPNNWFWTPCSFHRCKQSPSSLFRLQASLKPRSVRLTALNEDTLKGECFDVFSLMLLILIVFMSSPLSLLGSSPSLTFQSVCQRRCWQVC